MSTTRSNDLPRNRTATTERIIAAVGEVLARDGFAKIGINAIAKQAGVDKVLIYRYFGGLPALLEAWGKSSQFWPSVDEFLHGVQSDFFNLPLAERYAEFFSYFIDSLRKRPLTIEILAGEIGQRNVLTEILEKQREIWAHETGKVLAGQDVLEKIPELLPLSNLLVAGVQYLLVRSRQIRLFGGVDIQSDEGWAELKGAILFMARRTFSF